MDALRVLVDNALALVAKGYYERAPLAAPAPSLVAALRESRRPVIAEVKLASPSSGELAVGTDVGALLDAYVRGGACALSVLTEPRFFHGRLEHLERATATGLPVLMKDVVVHPAQVRCAAGLGAAAILLIERVFDRYPLEHTVGDLVAEAHRRGLEVLLEVNSVEEYDAARSSEADLIGINNRDLARMAVDLGTTERVLRARGKDRPVVSLSGIESPADVRRLRAAGADAFLVGSALVRSGDAEAALRRLVEA